MEQVQRKTAYEIVKETIDYYIDNPERRAKNGNGCYYLAPNTNNKCAVGRCMISPSVNMISTIDQLGISGDEEEYIPVESLLMEEYRGHSIKMWKNLQNWHDDTNERDVSNMMEEKYWSDKGITEKGRERAQELLEMYRDK